MSTMYMIKRDKLGYVESLSNEGAANWCTDKKDARLFLYFGPARALAMDLDAEVIEVTN